MLISTLILSIRSRWLIKTPRRGDVLDGNAPEHGARCWQLALDVWFSKKINPVQRGKRCVCVLHGTEAAAALPAPQLLWNSPAPCLMSLAQNDHVHTRKWWHRCIHLDRFLERADGVHIATGEIHSINVAGSKIQTQTTSELAMAAGVCYPSQLTLHCSM